MPREVAPAFQFYPADWLSGSQAALSCEEAGVYIRLLCHAWLMNGLPDDIPRLGRMVGCKKARVIRTVLDAHWNLDSDSRWRNTRQEEVRRSLDEYRESQAGNARKRWCHRNAMAVPRHSHGNAMAVPSDMPNVCSSSSSTSPTEKRTPRKRSPVQAFLDWFYAEYERASDGQKCLPKWGKHGALVKPILETYGERRARELAWVFLRYDCDKWGKVPRTVEAFHGWIESVPMYEQAALRTWGLAELDDARLGLAEAA